jgi:hypothetical protein
MGFSNYPIILRARVRVRKAEQRDTAAHPPPRTTKRFPSPRCASAIYIVCLSESTAETQPQLQPALLSLSAITSQYFTQRIEPRSRPAVYLRKQSTLKLPEFSLVTSPLLNL